MLATMKGKRKVKRPGQTTASGHPIPEFVRRLGVGLGMDFYAGNAAGIGRHLRSLDLDAVRVKGAWADFSLHLLPEDLELLMDSVCALLERERVSFVDCLETKLTGDGRDSAAWRVSDEGVSALAAFPRRRLRLLANTRLKQGARIRGSEPDRATSDCIKTLWDLLSLCRRAARRKMDVVYFWYL